MNVYENKDPLYVCIHGEEGKLAIMPCHIPILTDFQVCTGKYKALVFCAQSSASRQAALENSGFVFSSADLEIS